MNKLERHLSERERIAARLREVRTMRGMSQRELAEAAQLTHRMDISRWERGVAMPSLMALRDVCKALRLTMTEFLGY